MTATTAPTPVIADQPVAVPRRHQIVVGSTMTRRQKLVYILMLGALVALGPFTIDLYLPAFPSVQAELMTTAAAIQLTLTATTVGFGLGQLIVGPLSDAFGRIRPLLFATALHILASVGVALAPTVEWVMAGRVLQGIGAAGGGVVAMAIVRDLFAGQALIRMLARLALVTGLAPVLAPVIGSQLLRFIDWRGVFVVLAIYGVLVLVAARFVIRETHPVERRGGTSLRAYRIRYAHLLGDASFVGIAVVGATTFTALFSYLSASSFVLQEVFELSAQEYGIVFGLNSIGLVIANQTSARLMRVFAPRAVAGVGLSVMLTGSLLLFVTDALSLGLLGVLVPLFFVVASVGLIMPTVQVTALANHGAEAGTAASLIGALNFGVAGVISPLVGFMGVSVVSMATVMVGALVVGNLIFWLVVRPRVQSSVIA
ncbi:multidrug effflux MFS transporter [Demequina lignilytica]|uniref:Multidrug effflux MFS transporter n=1 Tax=Demequina lignilytica TaxID=3051663 RepID=A0AB35MKT8_9MICO|nr:multidrug effflux MFS transporter [Demequina sp. SYSU T0a273]MDN4484430.1 multidrug effflux MFS transporter [Demequina sp. SYSU T0a273]